jgi:hypothetical protein
MLDAVVDSKSETVGERTLSLQFQITFQQSEMNDGEPTEAAVGKLAGESRGYLESKYRVSHLDILDDELTSYLLAKEEE